MTQSHDLILLTYLAVLVFLINLPAKGLKKTDI